MSVTDTPTKTKRWYIVHAYSNFEKKVQESIREQAKQRHLDHLFEEILVPTEKLVEVRRGRKVDAERKFFPGFKQTAQLPEETTLHDLRRFMVRKCNDASNSPCAL